jgi:hypothetical protein
LETHVEFFPDDRQAQTVTEIPRPLHKFLYQPYVQGLAYSKLLELVNGHL